MLLRSLLFVPGNKPKMLAKALGLGADGLIVDLEDGVPPSEKESARDTLGKWVRDIGPTEKSALFVRVNALSTGLTEADLGVTLCPSVAGVMLPKAEGAGDIEQLGYLLEAAEKQNRIAIGSTIVIALVESAKSLINAYQIASASPRMAALAFGAEDYTLDLGTQRSSEGTELFFARSQIVVSARAAEIAAIDAIYTDLADDSGLSREVRLARQLGFEGKLVIHPKQINPVNAGFEPSEGEIAYARQVVAAFDEAEEAGTGVISLDGKMIDVPIVRRARKLVDFAGDS